MNIIFAILGANWIYLIIRNYYIRSVRLKTAAWGTHDSYPTYAAMMFRYYFRWDYQPNLDHEEQK